MAPSLSIILSAFSTSRRWVSIFFVEEIKYLSLLHFFNANLDHEEAPQGGLPTAHLQFYSFFRRVIFTTVLFIFPLRDR